MKKSRSVKKSTKLKKRSAQLSRAALASLLGAVALIAVVALSMSGADSSNGVAASDDQTPASVKQRRYRATRPIAVDPQTGQSRMPTKQEVDETVRSLSKLTKRQSEGLQQSQLASGAVVADLDGGFGGVVLARPKDDGSWEAKCVFTFEEGIEFLGLVEENSAQ